MTQSDHQQWHALLDALADGELQVNLRTKESPLWTSASYLNTEVGPHMFRRKPKPREWKVLLAKNGNISSRLNSDHIGAGFTEVIVREVLD